MTHSQIESKPQANRFVPMETLRDIVAGFKPDEIGLVQAWDELYYACQAAAASPELLAAIHEIKESIEEAEGAA